MRLHEDRLEASATRGAAGRRARLAGGLLLWLVAGGTPPVVGGEVRLRLEVPPKSVRGMRAAADRAVLDAFLRKHPEIKVEPHVKLRMQGPRAEATFYMSMAGGTAPDALYVYGRSTQKYIDQGFLCPLDEYLTDDIRADPLFQKFLPAISRDGKVYGIPALVAGTVLIYRKDLFQQAGLDPERPPATWEQLLACARGLTFPEQGQYGIVLPGGFGAGWRFANFVWQAGGEIVRRGPDGSWKLTLDEAPAVRALEFYRQMRWGKWTRDGRQFQGCMRVDSSGQSMEHFNEGRAAMTLVSTTGDVGRFLQAGLDPSQVGFAPLPAGPGGRACMLEGEFWGINRLIAGDKARRDAAWRYIRFLVSDEAKAIRTRTCVEAGWAMSVNPKWLRRFGYAAELRGMPDEWVEFYDRIVEFGRLEPYAPGYDQVATELLAQLDEVLYGEHADPAAVLGAITRRANTVFFGTTPDHVVAHRRRVARVVFGAIVAGALGLVAWALLRARRRRRAARKAPSPGHAQSAGGRTMRSRLTLLAWCFMLPAVVTILVWRYYPLVRGAALAFMDYRILGDDLFVGLDNFIEAFTQQSFWRALGQTGIYALMALALGFPIPILLAMLLSEIPWGKLFFRTVFYLPAVTSGLVVMFIWKMMYDDSAQGVYNQALAWVTTTSAGRAAAVGLFVAAWAAAVALLSAIVVSALRWAEARRRVLPWLLLALVAPLWLDGLVDVAAGAASWAGLPWAAALSKLRCVTPLLDGLALRAPLAFVVHGAARGAAVVVTVLAVLLLLRRGRADLRRPGLLVAGVAVVVMGASLALHLRQVLVPLARPYAWLQDPSGYWAMFYVILPGIWAGAGPGCIIYLAAIKSIPEELYEAADVDGAGPLDKAYHVTFQYLKPLILINFVGAFVGTFHAMQNILVMTGGGPGYKTMTIGMDIFFNAFTHLKFGYATAEAWILGSLLIGFTVYQLRILKHLRFTRAA